MSEFRTHPPEQFTGSFIDAARRLETVTQAAEAERGSVDPVNIWVINPISGMQADGRMVHIATVQYRGESGASDTSKTVVAVGSAYSDETVSKKLDIPSWAEGFQIKDGSHAWLQLDSVFPVEPGSDVDWLRTNVGSSIRALPAMQGKDRPLEIDGSIVISGTELRERAAIEQKVNVARVSNKVGKKPGILRRLFGQV